MRRLALLSRDDLSVIEERIPPGHGEVAHLHTRARQLFYVLGGRLAIELADGLRELRRGDSLEVPPGAVHRVHNPFDEDSAAACESERALAARPTVGVALAPPGTRSA